MGWLATINSAAIEMHTIINISDPKTANRRAHGLSIGNPHMIIEKRTNQLKGQIIACSLTPVNIFQTDAADAVATTA